MFRFSVVTFGCRVNQADSFACERDLLAAGGAAASPEDADLVVVNTCSVTAAADQAARNLIRRVARRNPSARIVPTGCYATHRPGDLRDLPGVVRVVPNEQKQALASGLSALGIATSRETGAPSPERALFRPGARDRTAFPLRVQTGCDEACTYCTIPASRGPSRSRPPGDALGEARALVACGYKELILTGVHLGAYGRDLQPPSSLAGLLEALDALPGEFRVRVSSLEPMDCPSRVIDLVARSGRFARHLHLPLQHASDRLLRAMGRPYGLADYGAVVDRARAAMPDAAIGTDVIVGFPGETAADHEALARYLAASPVTHLHVFPYSARPATKASAMGGKVPAAIVSARCEELRALARRLAASFAGSQLGRVRPAITTHDGSRAVTDNYLKVAIPPGHGRNERVLVRIVSAAPLEGEVAG